MIEILTEQQALQILAVAKWFEDDVKATVGQAKKAAIAFLKQTRGQGDRVTIYAGSTDIGTMSFSKDSMEWIVTDEKAYAQWLTDNEIPFDFETRLPRYVTSSDFIASLVKTREATGEIPYGVSERVKSSGSIRTTQTLKQRTELEKVIQNLAPITQAMHFEEI